MFARKKRYQDDQAHSFSKRWEKVGRNLYRIHGDNSDRAIQEQARGVEQSCKANLSSCNEAIKLVEAEIEKTQLELDQEVKAQGVPVEKARSKAKGAALRLLVASLMILVGICIIAWSLAPFFYGNEWLWLIVSAGSGIVIFVCMEVLLRFMEKILNPRQFYIFNALAATVMVAFFLAGFVQMSQARAIQMEIRQQIASDSEVYEEEMKDINELKSKLNRLAERAMIFLFIGFEWLTGVFFYLASRAIGKLRPIVKLAKRRERMMEEKRRLAERRAFVEKVDSKSIEGHLRNGVERERNKGSLPLMVAVLIIILGVCIGCVILAEKAFGGECRYYLVAYDVTGSTEHDQRENQRAIIKIIKSLQPCDEFQLMNITQNTFSDPEYMIHHTMPPKPGYFDEQVQRHRLKLIREFRSKCEEISKSRPATSLVDGLLMFTHLLQERPGMDRKLILISDMLQFKEEVTPAKIAEKGSKVLSRFRADGLIPDMSGIDVYAMGASTARLDARTWMGVKRFWVNYFKQAGACLKCYSIQRHWPVK